MKLKLHAANAVNVMRLYVLNGAPHDISLAGTAKHCVQEIQRAPMSCIHR